MHKYEHSCTIRICDPNVLPILTCTFLLLYTIRIFNTFFDTFFWKFNSSKNSLFLVRFKFPAGFYYYFGHFKEVVLGSLYAKIRKNFRERETYRDIEREIYDNVSFDPFLSNHTRSHVIEICSFSNILACYILAILAYFMLK